jgi:hypothetical protein
LLWEPYLAYLEGNGRAQRFRRAVLERLLGCAPRRARRWVLAARAGRGGGRLQGKQD